MSSRAIAPARLLSSTRGDRAIEYLERMVAHLGGVVFIGIDPVLSQMLGHPRYDAVVTRAGLPTVSGARTAST